MTISTTTSFSAQPLIVPKLAPSAPRLQPVYRQEAAVKVKEAPVKVVSSLDMPKPTKVYGPTLAKVYVAIVDSSVSTAEFLAKAGKNCVALERWMSKDLLYFTGDVDESMKAELKIRERLEFKQEIRRSRVLILSIKGKASLSLGESRELVAMSNLRHVMSDIELIAVNPKTAKKKVSDKKGAANQSKSNVVHAYAQFVSEEAAAAMVNKVDAMRYKDWYVHSPQCDEHAVFFPTDHATTDNYVWKNPHCGVQDAPKLSKKSSCSSSVGSCTESRSATPPSSSMSSGGSCDSVCGSDNEASDVTPPPSPQVTYTGTLYDQDMLYTFFN